ncbi:ubiquitin carboxyl-terminal hydrolase 23-like [Dioscorea cayenensis subsp. rotundata]|uniref:Ubiquitin carboxyl-terminal hydrolase 23-like n=1 Tax=Dioscorea cayennensis subsp. rotundata TaxID=55577 RepID=A0AB40BFD1_DIOCR|nr:ubiquitin carboxyl-terminal hydrolase 23-like [Dioscorea cayenensis subsp. rotundata]
MCAFTNHLFDALYLTGQSSFEPKSFINNRREISLNFVDGEQEDAHEYLQSLLTSIHECCVRLSKVASMDSESLITQVFGGRLRSQTRCCDCGHKSETFEPVTDLSLEISGANDPFSAFESFTRLEMIDDPENRFTCSNCNAKVTVEKQMTIDNAPQVLIIHLKRFSFNGNIIKKNFQEVDFSLSMNLSPFVNNHVEEAGDLNYRLYAVIVHLGSPSYGHYVSFVHSDKKNWYLMSDEKVMMTRFEEVKKQKAYILFYVKEGISSSSVKEFMIERFKRNFKAEEESCSSSTSDESGCISDEMSNVCSPKVDEKSLHDKKADTGEDEEVSNKNEEDEKKKRKAFDLKIS